MDRCRYPSKPCLNARAVKLNGDLHRFCEQHRRQANQNQMRWSKRKQTVMRTRRGGEDDGEDDMAEGSDGGGGGGGGERPAYNGPPPPPGAMLSGPPPPPNMHGVPNSVNAASASLSHMSLHNHNHGHGHPHPLPHGHPHGHPHAHGHGLSHSRSLELSYREAGGMHGANGMAGYQDHIARGGVMPGPGPGQGGPGPGGPAPGGVNMAMHPGMRRDLPPGAMKESMADMMDRNGGRPNSAGVSPIQTALPPLLPQGRSVDQPDPSAVHALLMLAPNAVMSSSQPQHEPEGPPDDEDSQVRRELKRAKSNEWIARPTLSPAGLPHMPSLAPQGPGAAGIGRSASWQPPRDAVNESLTQFMQRKQASLPSLTNITRIEKRSYDSISSSVPMSTSAPSTAGYLHHRGPEPSSVPGSHAPSGVHSRGVYAPLHPAPQKSPASSGSGDPVEHATSGSKRSALV